MKILLSAFEVRYALDRGGRLKAFRHPNVTPYVADVADSFVQRTIALVRD